MRAKIRFVAILILSSIATFSYAEEVQPDSTKRDTLQKPDAVKSAEKKSEWYEKISIRGYVQVRYNQLLETNPNLTCDQCDRSMGGNGGFFLRRIRVIFSGQLSERMYFYVQPDFASSPDGTNLQFAQIRDAYFDLGLDKNNEFRFRIGQSKVPYGFENMQSSQNRLPLDRNDALNSSLSNERDLGVFFYWAPKETRKLFSYLVSSGLKGSGDYGVLGLGVFNGQTANRNEANEQPHFVARLTYPVKVGAKQIIEPSIQAYTGKHVIQTVSAGVKSDRPNNEFIDERVAATFVLYPQPFGIQAEYNVGRGPKFNPSTNTIQVQGLTGGYVTATYQLKFGNHLFFPFSRYHYYDGGKKFERDARSYLVREWEIGTEWQPFRNFEFVAMYTMSQRRFEDGLKPVNFQRGNLLRLQAQLNF
ncbi:porin [Pedobacter sp. SYSU D00535]|uniref:porin n=1 Tax=Pedobacter sp. SYSU D00535 TaxID=2810308 RepID=UPI001A967233|nr:porin [Pedobacter sp. SYSU D00535]